MADQVGHDVESTPSPFPSCLLTVIPGLTGDLSALIALSSSPVIKILRVAQDDRGGRRLRMTPMRKAHAEQSVTCHAEVSVACHSEQSWVCHAERSEASLGVTCKSMCTHR